MIQRHLSVGPLRVQPRSENEHTRRGGDVNTLDGRGKIEEPVMLLWGARGGWGGGGDDTAKSRAHMCVGPDTFVARLYSREKGAKKYEYVSYW